MNKAELDARRAWQTQLQAGEIKTATYRSGLLIRSVAVVGAMRNGAMRICYDGCTLRVSPFDLHQT